MEPFGVTNKKIPLRMREIGWVLVQTFNDIITCYSRARGCTPYDCPSPVQTKFATPILYAIDNIEIYDIFSTYA